MRQSGFCGETGFTLAAGSDGGTDGDNVEAFGTVMAALQFGHGAVMPIGRASRRCVDHT